MAELTASGTEVGGGTGVLERAADELEVLDPPSVGSPDGGLPSGVEVLEDDGVGRSYAGLGAAAALLAAATGVSIWALGRTLGLVVVAGVLLLAVVIYRTLVQPWHTRWGATDREVQRPMLGDELLDDATTVTTRALTVDAPVDQVWAWLVELGIGPGGWAARGLIDDGRLGGNRIVPRLRNPAPSRAAVPGQGFEVVRIEAPHCMVSRGTDGTSWCLQLEDVGAGRTRLVSRFRSSFGPVPGPPIVLADPSAFLAERRLLKRLAARAESGAPLPRHASPCAP